MLYADSSALVKLFLEEEGSSEAQSMVRAADIVATSLVSYTALRAALAAAARARRISPVRHTEMANIPAGAPESVVRIVTENGRTLKFSTQGFETE